MVRSLTDAMRLHGSQRKLSANSICYALLLQDGQIDVPVDSGMPPKMLVVSEMLIFEGEMNRNADREVTYSLR